MNTISTKKKYQLLVGAVVILMLLLAMIAAAIIILYMSSTQPDAKAQSVVTLPSPIHTQLAPTLTSSQPASAQLISPPAGYQPQITAIQHPTPPPPSNPDPNLPTPTVVYLDTTLDFTPITPLVGWPAGGHITQGFGCTPNYTEIPGPNCPAAAPWFHGGVDIGSTTGAPVRAAMAGQVIFAQADNTGPWCGEYQGYGLAVMLNNGNDWESLYAHLSRIDVVTGQQVTPETIIGAVGQTGCTTGPHLHFGLRYQGTLVDAGLYMPEGE